jgi:hypothetical protein
VEDQRRRLVARLWVHRAVNLSAKHAEITPDAARTTLSKEYPSGEMPPTKTSPTYGCWPDLTAPRHRAGRAVLRRSPMTTPRRIVVPTVACLLGYLVC